MVLVQQMATRFALNWCLHDCRHANLRQYLDHCPEALRRLLVDRFASLHDLMAPDLHFFAFGVGFAGRRHFLLHFLLLLLLLHNRQSILQPHVAVAQQQQSAAQVFLEP